MKQQLENLYTGQYDPTKSRKKKQRQFDKVQKQTSNQTSLKFDQSRNADGIIPDNIEVNTGHATARKRDVKGNRMFFFQIEVIFGHKMRDPSPQDFQKYVKNHENPFR